MITSSDCGRNNKLEVQSVQVETARRRGQSANVEIARRRGQFDKCRNSSEKIAVGTVSDRLETRTVGKSKVSLDGVKTGYLGYDDLNVKWGRVLCDTRQVIPRRCQ